MLLHEPYADYYGAWRALEEMHRSGTLRAIGVSNFYPDRLVDICSFSKSVKPMVNQIEINPYNQQNEAKKWNDKYNVVVEAWAPFAEGVNGLFTNETLAEIGRKHGKSVAQVVLRWHIQRGIVVIPKSVHMERMRQNFDVFDFELDEGDMKLIETIDQKKSPFLSHQDPKSVEEFISLKDDE